MKTAGPFCGFVVALAVAGCGPIQSRESVYAEALQVANAEREALQKIENKLSAHDSWINLEISNRERLIHKTARDYNKYGSREAVEAAVKKQTEENDTFFAEQSKWRIEAQAKYEKQVELVNIAIQKLAAAEAARR